QDDVAFHLVEELLALVDVVVAPRVGPDHHDDEVGVLPHHLVADRRLEQVPVLVDPALEVERRAEHVKPSWDRLPACQMLGQAGGLSYDNFRHTFFGSVKKRSASHPPSRPTPDCFTPPK